MAKASFAFKISQKPSLADDSGLFVSALNNAPGVFSARYGKNDDERITRVLKEMADQADRCAQFKAVYVYYFGINEYKVFEGICDGHIATQARGSEGFGYDPIFIPKGFAKTFAELGIKTKNRISHRARALRKFKKYITRSLL
jgi:XTP/dITP diphosphohydrolase